MDSRTATERAPSSEAIEFVRFCYRRRRVGWPELYDEMCAVAGRGLFRGWGSDELSVQGIGFSLFELATLAALVERVVAEDDSRRPRTSAAAVRAAHVASALASTPDATEAAVPVLPAASPPPTPAGDHVSETPNAPTPVAPTPTAPTPAADRIRETPASPEIRFVPAHAPAGA